MYIYKYIYIYISLELGIRCSIYITHSSKKSINNSIIPLNENLVPENHFPISSYFIL